MKHICVYCGSRIPNSPELVDLASNLGKEIAQEGWTLVYGGGKVGTMGIIADAALDKGGEVIGVIPTHLKKAEVAHEGLTKLYETQDMHTRKALLENLSDVFVIIPGGFGTLDEFFEILTWKQLGIHSKPIILVNKSGYFNGLTQFFERSIDENYVRESSMGLFSVVESLEECLEILKG
ncbi:MAG: TIGR00730 family Rossman fold protein [Balneola sp.]|nr:MAG: TIGR00730 family Rossman fold protein [Balneola sp.]